MKIIPILFCLILFFSKSVAWGPEGHAIVGKIALQLVKPDVRQNVLKVLDNMSIDTAANWMDIMKSNSDYDFMRTWHYVDFPKGQPYKDNSHDNLLNRLTWTFNELKNKKVYSDEQIKFDLLVMFHLMGDLHMPLHAGYDEDLGGNRVMVQYDTMKTHNLHRFWDEDIIRLTNIRLQDCMALLKEGDIDKQKIDFLSWMKESRALLDEVYKFPDFTITEAYLKKNKEVVKKQLLNAGMRLAKILNTLFASPAAEMNMQSVTSGYKNGIDVNDAMKHLGKKVTVCSKVFGIRATDKITQINLGQKFPNNPLTIVIFASSYKNFKTPPAELYTDKNLCVQGKVEEYKGKAQIIVDKPEDIEIK